MGSFFRAYRILLVAGFLAGALVHLPVEAALIVVDTADDTLAGTCAYFPGTNDNCSLRQAITLANETTTEDTINMPPGQYILTLTGAGENGNLTGDLDVREDLVIVGAGAGLTEINGFNSDRVFDVLDNSSLELRDMSIREGTVADGGGGIRCNGDGLLQVVRSVVEDCYTTGTAGGIQAGCNLLLVDTVIRDNAALYNAGAVWISLHALLAVRSTFAGNTAGSPAGGSAIECSLGVVGLQNVTIAGNSGPDGNGGYSGWECDTTIDSCTIVGNSPLDIVLPEGHEGSMTVRRTYVYGACDVRGLNLLTSEGGNVEGPGNTCYFIDGTDQYNKPEPLVLPLGNHGGYTPTMVPMDRPPSGLQPILDNSYIDQDCLPNDQRGVSRPQDGDGDGYSLCDTGAVERLQSDPMWADGFESGDTSRWSDVFPD